VITNWDYGSAVVYLFVRVVTILVLLPEVSWSISTQLAVRVSATLARSGGWCPTISAADRHREYEDRPPTCPPRLVPRSLSAPSMRGARRHRFRHDRLRRCLTRPQTGTLQLHGHTGCGLSAQMSVRADSHPGTPKLCEVAFTERSQACAKSSAMWGSKLQKKKHTGESCRAPPRERRNGARVSASDREKSSAVR